MLKFNSFKLNRKIYRICLFAVCFSLYALMCFAQTRAISVVTEPNAAVWLDDVRFGTTGADGKLVLKTVSAGKHVIRVRADGFKELSQPLTAAQKGDVNIALTKTTDEAELAFQEAERLTQIDRDQAAAAYRKAVKLRPRYPQAYLALARVLSDGRDYDEALPVIRAARKLRPVYPELTAVEGRIYKEEGDETKAIAAFKRAIAEGKGFQPEALTGLGLIYKEKAEGFGGSGDFEQEKANYLEASKYLRKALAQLSGAPDSIIIYQLEGLIYEKMNDFTEAVAIYEEFLRLFPDAAEAEAVRSFITQIKKKQSNDVPK